MSKVRRKPDSSRDGLLLLTRQTREKEPRMEEQNKRNTFYAKLPDFTFAVRTSVKDVKFAVLARHRAGVNGRWSKWYVARWSTSLELAEKHARYLKELCPAVRRHAVTFETEVVPVIKNLIKEEQE